MSKFNVTLKYGNPGEYKHNSQVVSVEADSEAVAIQLAINKLRNSNSVYRDKEIDAVKIEKK